MPISQQLLDRLSENDPTLTELNLSEQITSQDDVALFLQALINNTHLSKLTIHGKYYENKRITIDDAAVNVLAQHHPFEYLDLSYNFITNDSMHALAEHPALGELCLNGCNVGIAGSYQLCTSESLEKISLWNNKQQYEERGKIWSLEELVGLLSLTDATINQDLLINALANITAAKVEILTYLNEQFDMGFNIECHLKYDIRESIYNFLDHEYNTIISNKLAENRGQRDPNFLAQHQAKRTQSELAKQVDKAIRNSKFGELAELIPRLENGVNTLIPDYGWVLCLANATRRTGTIKFLLDRGAMIELAEREKTSLYEAAEAGEFELVKLYLQYGSNITGEFYFNAETALSIAAFKIANYCIHAFRPFLHNQIIPKAPTRKPSIAELSSDKYIKEQRKRSVVAAAPTENSIAHQAELVKICSDWDILFESAGKITSKKEYTLSSGIRTSEIKITDPLWIQFGNRVQELSFDFTQRCIKLFTVMQEDFDGQKKEKIDAYINCYKLLRDKFSIIHGMPLLDRTFYFNHLRRQYTYKLRTVKPIPAPPPTRQAAVASVAALNNALREQKELDLDWDQQPTFWVAEYRCVHYYSQYFTQDQLLEHAHTSHLNRMAPAPAAYFMADLDPGRAQVARETELIKHKDSLREFHARCKETGVYQYKGKRYGSVAAAVQEQMSNHYDGFKEDVKARRTPAHEMLDDMKAHGYPSFATSDLPEHALRYGYGKKPIPGLNGRLAPRYRNNGKPTNPILGKVFISLMSPLQMARERMCHVAGMHNKSEIKLCDTVAPERETGAYGGLAQGYLFYEQVLSVPDFSQQYSNQIELRFGINLQKFGEYKAKFVKARRSQDILLVENEIVDFIKVFTKHKLLQIAQQQAQQRGGILIYRYRDREYGLEPEVMQGRYVLYRHEQELMRHTGRQRFATPPASAAPARRRSSAQASPYASSSPKSSATTSRLPLPGKPQQRLQTPIGTLPLPPARQAPTELFSLRRRQRNAAKTATTAKATSKRPPKGRKEREDKTKECKRGPGQ